MATQQEPQNPNEITVGKTKWHLWRSDAGKHYATRRGRLTDAQMGAGYAMTVAANTSEELRSLLDKQSDAAMAGDA